jgi:sucrose-6-phosphate hydrolase SacC (GH32 family)
MSVPPGACPHCQKINFLSTKPPYPGTLVHWDGQLWKDGGAWYQLCGGKFANGGAAVLWSSPDLENWTYRNRIA